jgi:hypothetical protein
VDNIKMDLRERGCDSMDWIDLTQDSDQWRALVNTVMSIRFEVFTAVTMKKAVFWNVAPCR